MSNKPKTLQDAIIYFADADNCLNYLVARRWPNGVSCPTCGRTDVAFIPARRVWQCKTRHPKAQFSIKVGTIFEDSPITLDKWLLTMWMIANCKNGISSYEISRATGISQKSAWFMLQRLRLALQGENGGKLGGELRLTKPSSVASLAICTRAHALGASREQAARIRQRFLESFNAAEMSELPLFAIAASGHWMPS